MEAPLTRRDRPRNPLSVAIVGLLLITFGGALLADNLGYGSIHHLLAQFWPFGLMLWGLAALSTRRHEHAFWGLALIFAGAWAYASQQHWLRVNFWALFGPTLLVLAGGSVLWRAFNRPGLGASDAYVRAFAIFGGSEMRPVVPFEGADLTAVMGGTKLDLRSTTMAGESATVDVFAFMGGSEILVPSDWDVTVKVVSIMGGVADKRRPATNPPTRHLIVRGFAMMGGVEIKD